MKKAICILLLTLLLSGCAHTHTADWKADAAGHWKSCDCGEKFESGGHTLDEDNRCAACGAEVIAGAESADVSFFNEQGDVTACTVYDAEGNITLAVRNEYTYDESGNVRSVMRYENGAQVSCIHYDADGKECSE